jgi:hypothetical protein
MKTKHIALALAATLGLSVTSPVGAEEGGSGHYLPGSMASFMDAVPPQPTFIARYNFVSYNGSFGGNPIPFARFVAANVNAGSYASGLTLLWRPPIDLGEHWSFALSTTIPYVWLDVSGDATPKVTLPNGMPAPTVRRSDSVNGVGDIVLMPLMLNYKFTPDFSMNFRVGIYAPTGSYELGRLANTGKNFWTIEPTLAFMYFGQKSGIEASLFAGFDFNTENGATQYQSGIQFHIDGTLAQHLPLGGGLAGVGVNGYWYQQITGDSGPGASLGDFEGSTAGLGPVVSYVHKIGKVDMLTELKWLHEVETQKRLKGDYIWLKVIFKF